MRTASIDRQLITVTFCLVLFGLATLYSASNDERAA